MLVNNPMGSRRRRRFYHRAGVVPIPGDHSKEDFTDAAFLNYEFEPFEYKPDEEEEFQPTSRITQGGKRRVNFITVSSLHSRLMDIIDSMIALAEAEDREKAKQEGTDQSADKEGDQDEVKPQTSAQGASTSAVKSSDSKTEKE